MTLFDADSSAKPLVGEEIVGNGGADSFEFRLILVDVAFVPIFLIFVLFVLTVCAVLAEYFIFLLFGNL